MPISLVLTSNEFKVFAKATKNKVEYVNSRNNVQITNDNYYPIHDAITDFHTKKKAVKIKTPDHMHYIMMCQSILSKMEAQAVHLSLPPVAIDVLELQEDQIVEDELNIGDTIVNTSENNSDESEDNAEQE